MPLSLLAFPLQSFLVVLILLILFFHLNLDIAFFFYKDFIIIIFFPVFDFNLIVILLVSALHMSLCLSRLI